MITIEVPRAVFRPAFGEGFDILSDEFMKWFDANNIRYPLIKVDDKTTELSFFTKEEAVLFKMYLSQWINDNRETINLFVRSQAENSLIHSLSEEIRKEIDQQIINDLLGPQ